MPEKARPAGITAEAPLPGKTRAASPKKRPCRKGKKRPRQREIPLPGLRRLAGKGPRFCP